MGSCTCLLATVGVSYFAAFSQLQSYLKLWVSGLRLLLVYASRRNSLQPRRNPNHDKAGEGISPKNQLVDLVTATGEHQVPAFGTGVMRQIGRNQNALRVTT